MTKNNSSINLTKLKKIISRGYECKTIQRRGQLYSITNLLVGKSLRFGHKSENNDRRGIKMSFVINFITSG